MGPSSFWKRQHDKGSPSSDPNSSALTPSSMPAPSENIDHRLTKPEHPWTNGQVQRMNRTLKEATVKRFYSKTHQHFGQHLLNFVDTSSFARRPQGLRRAHALRIPL